MKRRSGLAFRGGWTLGLLLAFGPAQAEDKVELNTITKVEVKESTIEITGSKKPSFTTFTMQDPPRLVIDLSEAVFSGVPDESKVGNGFVAMVKTVSYGSDTSAIARILVQFTHDFETDITTSGNRIVIRLPHVKGPAVAEGTGTSPEAPQKQAGADATAAAAKAQAQDAGAAQAAQAKAAQADAAQKQAEADAKAEAQKAQKAQEARDQAAAAKRAEAEAEEKARKADEAKQAAVAERQRQEQERKAKAEEAARAAQEERERKAAERKAAEEERKAQAEEARQAALAEQQRKAEERKAAEAERRSKAEEARKAALEDKQRKAEERKAKAEEARQAALAEKQRKAEERKAKAEEARARSLEAKKAAEERRREQAEAREAAREEPASVAAGGKPRMLTFVGFAQVKGAARVFVRTSQPVQYNVRSSGDRVVVLELENTRFGRGNDERRLDTSYFGGPVALVNPLRGPGRSVHVEIRLKGKAEYQAHQNGNEVAVDFPLNAAQ